MKNKGNIVAITFIIIIITITAVVAGWLFAKKTQAPIAQTVLSQPEKISKQLNATEPVAQPALEQQNKANPVNWKSIEFDECGDKTKYEKLSWWNKFAEKIANVKYYSDSYITSQVTTVNENAYYNPTGIKFTKDTLCSDLNKEGSIVCGKGKNRKLSIGDLNDYGEGCLAKDGSVFVVVFPGGYMGGGNYVFRYDINNNILETANKVNELKDGFLWFAPPTSFEKRVGNIIKMTGGSADGGCGSDTEFDYDFALNQIKLTKKCSQCDGEKRECETF